MSRWDTARGEPSPGSCRVLPVALGYHTLIFQRARPSSALAQLRRIEFPLVPLGPQNLSLLLICQDLPPSIICAPGSIAAWGNYVPFPGTPGSQGWSSTFLVLSKCKNHTGSNLDGDRQLYVQWFRTMEILCSALALVQKG